MSIPGRLSIGILEEDNPQKAYFRFIPKWILENGAFAEYDSTQFYPDSGAMRVVPDKNESGHFKQRMRRLVRYAVVDLREHPDMNDKIRDNKNYGVDEEANSCIIYSDVIREPAEGSLFPVLNANDPEIPAFIPAETRVLMSESGALRPEIYTVSAERRAEPDGSNVDTAAFKVFGDGMGSMVAISASAIPAPAQPAAPAADVTPRPAAQASQPAAAAAPESPVRPEAPVAAPVPDIGRVKPWINHTDMPPGLIPAARRGRSLQEIVDEKWRHSRMDQLGHTPKDISTGTPVASPSEQAVEAICRAWVIPEQREQLTQSIAGMAEFRDSVYRRKQMIEESNVNRQLNELEARRLQLLDELKQLENKSNAVRTELKKEILADEEAAFADAVRRTEAARARQAQAEADALSFREQAEELRSTIHELHSGTFESRIREFVQTSHVVDLIRAEAHPRTAPQAVLGTDITAEEAIERVIAVFLAGGRMLTREQAIDLLICVAQSPCVIFTGAPGSGKSVTAQLLAKALGIAPTTCEPGDKDLSELSLPEGNALKLVLLDDFNLSSVLDPCRGLNTRADRGDLTILATAQYEGMPIAAFTYGRAFTICVDPMNYTLPRSSDIELPPVRACALRKAFAPDNKPLPETVTQRLNSLMTSLELLRAPLPARVVHAVMSFCSAALPLMQTEPSAVLDMALAQRAIPLIMASAPLDSLRNIDDLFRDMPRCTKMLHTPLPLRI